MRLTTVLDQEELRKKTWRIQDIPFYERGKAPDISKLETLDFLDTKEKVYGRKFGRTQDIRKYLVTIQSRLGER